MIRWIFPNTHLSRSLTMPATTLLDIPEEEQVQMLAALRRARYGYLLALHVFLLCAAGRHPTEIAACLLCSRSSIYHRLLLDSRVVDLSMASNPTFVFLSSLEPLFFNSPENELRFSDNTGA